MIHHSNQPLNGYKLTHSKKPTDVKRVILSHASEYQYLVHCQPVLHSTLFRAVIKKTLNYKKKTITDSYMPRCAVALTQSYYFPLGEVYLDHLGNY